MNIFVTNDDYARCAEALDDKRVIKMVLETAQILCAVNHRYGVSFPGIYAPTHANHPCTKWAGDDRRNFDWLWGHGQCLVEEYAMRTGKIHKCHEVILSTSRVAHIVPGPDKAGPPGSFVNCTPHKDMEVKAAYRQTLNDKWHADVRAPKWTLRSPPHWARIGYRRVGDAYVYQPTA